jgi:transcription initiation factor TFIIH subunit 1
VFTSPPAQAAKDRDAFKGALSTILSQNRAGGASGTATPTQNGPVLPASANGNARAPLPGRPPAGGPVLPTRATSTVGDSNGGHSRTGSAFGGSPAPSVAPGAGLSADDIRLRKKVLVANPDLMGLHRDLVMSGQITEAEFWEGREVYFNVSRRILVLIGMYSLVSPARPVYIRRTTKGPTRPNC